MTKPHAQRIAIATGWEIEDVRSFIKAGEGISGTPYESTADVIAAIRWDEHISSSLDSDLPFDHAMGAFLGGMGY